VPAHPTPPQINTGGIKKTREGITCGGWSRCQRRPPMPPRLPSEEPPTREEEEEEGVGKEPERRSAPCPGNGNFSAGSTQLPPSPPRGLLMRQPAPPQPRAHPPGAPPRQPPQTQLQPEADTGYVKFNSAPSVLILFWGVTMIFLTFVRERLASLGSA